MRFLLRYFYAPLFCGGFIGGAIWLIGYRQASEWWLLALLAGALLISFAAEALAPYQVQWNEPRHDGWRDVCHALVNESLNLAGILSIPLLAVWLPGFGYWPAAWPLWQQVLLAIVVADFGITLVHWLSHRYAVLWRLHAVHHSVTRMYGFNGLMKHPLHQALEASAGIVPLLLLGMPQQVGALLAFAIAVQLLLQHSNVDMRIGALRHVFAWAPLHRFHHLKYGRAGDVNFALFFSGWDRLLGTAFYQPDYQLSSDDLGIGSQPDFPSGYVAHLLAPFRPLPQQSSPPLPAGLQPSVQNAQVQVR